MKRGTSILVISFLENIYTSDNLHIFVCTVKGKNKAFFDFAIDFNIKICHNLVISIRFFAIFEVFMRATFGFKREQKNELVIMNCKTLVGDALHFHSQIEVFLLHEGEVEVFIGEKRRVMKGGSVAIAVSYEPHTYRTLTDASSSIAFVPTYLCEEFVQAVKNKKPSDPFISDERVYRKVLSCFEELSRDGINAIERIGYVGVMLGTLLSDMSFEQRREVSDTSLTSRLLLYINENYKQRITADTLATEFGYSSHYISTLFRSSFGIGVQGYLSTVRLKNALMLMHEGSMNVTECALESGFGSIRTFYRAFESEMGCSPLEYLKGEKL